MSDELKPYEVYPVVGGTWFKLGRKVVARNIRDFVTLVNEERAAVKERGEDTELRRVAKEVLDRLRESKIIAATAQHFECAVELKQLADRLDAAMQQQPRRQAVSRRDVDFSTSVEMTGCSCT